MQVKFQDPVKQSRLIAVTLYYNWIKKNNITDYMDNLENLETIFYNKRWNIDYIFVIEKIFSYLVEHEILLIGGGMYGINKEKISDIKLLEELNLLEYQKHPTLQFIEYGLKILEELLEGGVGGWNMQKYGFLFEKSLTQNVYEYILKDLLSFLLEQTNKTDEEVVVVLYGVFIHHISRELVLHLPSNVKFYNIVSEDEFFEHHISIAELKNVYTSSRRYLYQKSDVRIKNVDIIITTNSLGFGRNVNTELRYLSELSKFNTVLCGLFNFDNKSYIGFEPLFPVHDLYKGIFGDANIFNLFTSNGFSKPTLIGKYNMLYFSKKYS
ncbi:MAG: hypothetical protein OEY49_19510 [Candidatus Heimdallarchaeota archaeon]|nr:hypothetical protein [Candidatus Heimdallarchaeota archaeon]